MKSFLPSLIYKLKSSTFFSKIWPHGELPVCMDNAHVCIMPHLLGPRSDPLHLSCIIQYHIGLQCNESLASIWSHSETWPWALKINSAMTLGLWKQLWHILVSCLVHFANHVVLLMQSLGVLSMYCTYIVLVLDRVWPLFQFLCCSLPFPLRLFRPHASSCL